MLRFVVLSVAVIGIASAADIVRRDTSGGGHGHDHGASAQVASGSSGYAAPAASYGAPSSSYDQPSYGYSAPEPSYGAPQYYEDDGDKGFPIAALLIPLLILAGLALLFPTVTTVTGRKKRDVDGGKMT